ncbi:GEA2 [Candida jiufengensis]|uniref:GEA2 n=1 Tax=Candida jiufengensis TaxID=497108 RepID=UPI002224E484|nr:GEA2 [Candida jiufengensis]KAI5953232.1 GEA2 [Candida jiufengensis]
MTINTNNIKSNNQNWVNGKAVSVDPITLVINECMIMVSAMRRSNKWPQGGVASLLNASELFGGNDDRDGFSSSLGISSILNNHNVSSDKNFESNGSNSVNRPNHDNPLLSSFLQLRTILTDANDIYDIDCLTLLQPFLLVIKSSTTSGYVTGLSLNAVSKFLTYEIISLNSKNLQHSLIQIVSALTHCRFEAADQNSDDAVLLKVLRLMEKLMESPLSNLLSNESVSEIVQTCLSLACNKKRSEVLRRAAEMSMMSITMEIFTRLREIDLDKESVDDLQTNFANTKLPEDTIGGTDALEIGEKNTSSENLASPRKSGEQVNEQFGIICINEFLGILVSIISPSNQYQHMESTRVFALSLINTAVEVAGTEIPKHLSLLTMIADPISKHILQIITTTESVRLLRAALQLFSTISIILGNQLKPQFELSVTLIIQTLSPEIKKTKKDQMTKPKNNNSNKSPIVKELLLESLSLLWIRSPAFFTQLYIDYDCKFDKSDLSENIISFLCKLSLPESALLTTHNVPPLCLEGVLSFVNGVNDRARNSNYSHQRAKKNKYIEKKLKKTAFIKCTELLNKDPKEGIKLLLKEKFIQDETAEELANFFFSKSGRLNKKMLGEYLAKPKNADLLERFIHLFEFKDLRVDEALRVLLKAFRLPGESQQIERVVEKFAEYYVSCQENSEGIRRLSGSSTKKGSETVEIDHEPVRPDKDSVFILSYSVIMLNTDLHNPQVKRQMLLEDYKRNLKGVYNGKDFPEWYLSKIYHSIKDREIIMPEEHHGTDKWFDDVWHNLISTQDFKQLNDLEEEEYEICDFDKYFFESVIEKIISTIMVVYNDASDDHIVTRLMSSVDKIINVCMKYDLDNAVDDLVNRLVTFSTLSKTPIKKSQTDDNIRDEIPITQIKLENKDDEVFVSDLAVWFGRNFKAQLAAVMLFRLLKKSRCKVTSSWDKVIEVILNLFENCLVDPNIFIEFQKKVQIGQLSKVSPIFIIKNTKSLNNSGLLSTFSSFLKGYSEDPPEPSDAEIEATLSTIDCIKSVNIPNVFATVSKSDSENLIKFIELLLLGLPKYEDKSKRFYETETLFILEACVCFALLLNEQNIMSHVLSKLNPKNISKKSQIRLTAYKLLLLRYCENYTILLETVKSISIFDKELIGKQGGQIVQPLLSLLDDDSWCCKKLLFEEEYWNTLRFLGSLQVYAFDIIPFLEVFIKNSKDEITPINFVFVLALLDEISSLGAVGSQFEQENEQVGNKKIDNLYYKDVISLSKKSIELTTILTSKQKENEEYQEKGLIFYAIQAIGHQCFNPCREVREFAVKSLKSITFSIELEQERFLNGLYTASLFPLFKELSKPEVFQKGKNGFDITQTEVFSIMCKVFLKNLDKLSFETTKEIWFELLTIIQLFNENNGKFLKPEQIELNAENIKNLLLVLETNGLLTKENEDFYSNTWNEIDKLFPQLSKELKNDTKVEPNEAEKEVKSDEI